MLFTSLINSIILSPGIKKFNYLVPISSLLSCSAHTSNQYESRIFATNFCLNTSKNANITLYTQKIKALCNTLNWGNWNLGFVKLVVRWAERDNSPRI